MSKLGNKINSWLNGEWGKHAKNFWKKLGSKRRRIWDKRECNEDYSRKMRKN